MQRLTAVLGERVAEFLADRAKGDRQHASECSWTAPLAGHDQEFQELSEEAPVEAQASPDDSDDDGGALELVFGAAGEGVEEETDEVAWGALPESHESVSELRASESHGFELSVGSVGAEVSDVEEAQSGSEQVDAAAAGLGGSEEAGDDVQDSSEFELAHFEQDSNAFTVAQHLSDPEAHPVQYSDDWFNAPTPPRGVVQVAEPEVPTVASLPQETIVVPTPAKGAEAQSTTVELDTFDLVEGGRAGSAASAQSEDATDFASDPHGGDDAVREHPAAWFYEPRQPEVSAAESNQNDGSPGTLPATPIFDADRTLEPESAPETAFEIALPAEPELAPLYEFASDSAESSAAGVESPSEGIREQWALPPSVELEAEPEPVAIDRGPVGMPEVTEPESAAVAASELADPTLGRVLQEENTPESAMPEMFVTETMAELYLQQGFVEEALQVYRKLLEWSPGDEGIRSRIAALEAGAPSSIAEAASAAHALDRAGQSVRHFFGRIARRSAAPRAQRESALDLVSLGAQMASRHDSGDAPGDRSVSPTLTELFANAKRPGDDDDAAAQQLASAFSPPETAGRPSRAADSELSLDHLFRDVPRESSGAVTLDAFFAASGGDTSEASDAADDAADEARTGDIEQFTAWLEGLKKK